MARFSFLASSGVHELYSPYIFRHIFKTHLGVLQQKINIEFTPFPTMNSNHLSLVSELISHEDLEKSLAKLRTQSKYSTGAISLLHK